MVPLDLTEAGTSLTTEASAPEVPAELELAAVVGLAAADDEDELLPLLPHPAIAATPSSEIATESRLFRVPIAFLLLFESPRRLGQHMQHRLHGREPLIGCQHAAKSD
jgi:hypothetical protein